ncbi:MAG TPA: SpoIVB peptidase [Feifaniaceae bacterium]|nr:SpoIVB peptidase [Feifaniaceae bacterium]
MKKGFAPFIGKAFGILLCLAILTFNYMEPLSSLRKLSEDIYVQAGETHSLPFGATDLLTASSDDESVGVSSYKDQTLAEAIGSGGRTAHLSIRLFGVIPVKQVNIHVRDEITLVPGGTSIGVTLHTRGALVVGIVSITLSDGQELSPAAAAGIQAGDLIEKANGIEIKNADHLKQICNDSRDKVTLSIVRGGQKMDVELRPVLDPAEGKYRMGMWVRTSTAGVGTLSFYDPASKRYAALGHAITDVDTRQSLTVRDGEIVQSKIVDIVQGAQGEPGELRGDFGDTSLRLGTIETNSQYGIYGRMYKDYLNPLFPDGLPMAYPEEVQLGPAHLLTTLSNEGIRAYACKVIKINPQESPAPKGLVVEITDPELLQATGGIVQGMSGSPLIQNGKLIGVVTHVFINDPTKGYCMYTQWMQQQIA